MPINKELQDKILKIASNKAADKKVVLAIRKVFYSLATQEIDLEDKLISFNSELDKIISNLGVSINSEPEQESVEEIIMPKKQAATSGGVSVRMQEDIQTDREDTDFEVPYDAAADR
jgi:hypothetical protein